MRGADDEVKCLTKRSAQKRAERRGRRFRAVKVRSGCWRLVNVKAWRKRH